MEADAPADEPLVPLPADDEAPPLEVAPPCEDEPDAEPEDFDALEELEPALEEGEAVEELELEEEDGHPESATAARTSAAASANLGRSLLRVFGGFMQYLAASMDAQT